MNVTEIGYISKIMMAHICIGHLGGIITPSQLYTYSRHKFTQSIGEGLKSKSFIKEDGKFK